MSDIIKLRERIQSKIAAIPKPDEKLLRHAGEKNRLHAEELHRNKIELLRKKRSEAEREGNTKKRFAAIALEFDEKDRNALRRKISELSETLSIIERSFGEKKDIIEFFSEVKKPDFWKYAEKYSRWSKKEKYEYYVSMGITLNEIRKIETYIETNKKLNELKILDAMKKSKK